MQEVFRAITKAAATAATVLIAGKSGTGKELVARPIHYGSPRAPAPFVPARGRGGPARHTAGAEIGVSRRPVFPAEHDHHRDSALNWAHLMHAAPECHNFREGARFDRSRRGVGEKPLLITGLTSQADSCGVNVCGSLAAPAMASAEGTETANEIGQH